MKTPEHRAHPRAGKKFEADLDMHYLAPGAFTVLSLDADRIPDPPPAPPPYRIPVTTRRHRHQAFAIIGEATSSSPNSRSSSPSGRVSPFKGRGFNPIGSRHASPSISPVPPEDPRALSPSTAPTVVPSKILNTSKIPKPTTAGGVRKESSGAIFGEKVNHVNFRGLNRQASQSLTSLEEKPGRRRPPPSPRKKLKGVPAFKQLSPIEGSSPEPSQSLSSPSRIPTKSRSTPPSRLTSPTRERSRVPNRSRSKPNVAKSRDPSPLSSPTKIPIKKYQHVQSRISSFNKPKPPPRPPLSSDMSEDSESPKKKVLSRKNSLNRTSSRPNLLPKTFMGTKNQNYTSDSSISTDAVDADTSKTVSAKTFGPKVTPTDVSHIPSVGKTSISVAKTNNTKPTKSNAPAPSPKPNKSVKNDNNKKPSASETPKPLPKEDKVSSDVSNTTDTEKISSMKDSKIDLSDMESDDAVPSAIDVVSSTTNTVTKPLKIETPKLGRAKPVSPMIDGRVLSATSVSQAINKMNDTVLNTQTLIKDSGLQTRLTPAASAIIAVKSECNEKKGGIYDTPDDSAKKAGKEEGKTEAKQEDNKKVDDKPTAKFVETVDPSKTSDKTESAVPTDDKTAKVAPNNITTHFSGTQPVPKGAESQNNDKLPATVNVITHSSGIQPALKGAVPQNNDKLPATVTNNNHNSSNNNIHHSNNHVTTIGLGHAKAIEREVQNNMNKLLGSMDSSLGDVPVGKLSANDRIREARTVIAADVKPIRITVREKPSEVEVQSGNVAPHLSVANGVTERPSLPPPQQPSPPNEPVKEEPPPNRCKRFLNSCTKALKCNRCQRCKRATKIPKPQEEDTEKSGGCFKCLSKRTKNDTREQVRINIEDEDGEVKKKNVWQKLSCCKKSKVGDTQSCFPIGKRKESWVERRAGTFLESEVQQKTKCCSKEGCKAFFRRFFCCCCKKKEEPPPPITRKESMVSSKKKSLTPTSVPPPEDTTPKIDISLVEHTSHMKGAIPVLPVWLAWFCCIMNCIGPGTGTVFSGLFCLCIGKPRFSQKDGPKPRIGAFIIDLIIGFSQFFTVLFCLVGWGWSIWWGVIMVKVAKKHRKLKHLEKLEEIASKPQSLAGQYKRDVERGGRT